MPWIDALDGNCRLFGVNIFKDTWRYRGKITAVKVSNGVFGFYSPET